MHTVPIRTGGVTALVLAITMGFILLGSFASGVMSSYEPFLVLGLMLLIGLPHGATDHGLFLALTGGKHDGKKVSFYLLYTLVIGAYGLVWFLFPLLAFLIFMLLSVYHFGQSNWADVKYDSIKMARVHYLLWGCGILLTPILLHGQQAADIVASMTGNLLVLPPRSYLLAAISAMAGLNFFVALLFWWKGILTSQRLLKEVVGYGLLTAMFFTNSLLLGFTVYFVFWHSLASAKDQFQFFQRRLSSSVRRQLFLGILTTVGGALAFCLIVWFGPGPEAALQPGIVGGVFVFISLLTLPHMLLVEKLYANWSPVAEQKKSLGPLSQGSKNNLQTNRQAEATTASELTFFH